MANHPPMHLLSKKRGVIDVELCLIISSPFSAKLKPRRNLASVQLPAATASLPKQPSNRHQLSSKNSFYP